MALSIVAGAFLLAVDDKECPKFAAFAASKGPAPEGLRCKTVHLIRHAEGTHNAAEQMADRRRLFEKNDETRALREEHGIAWYLLEKVTGLKHWDAPLTATGRRQADKLRRELRHANVSFDAVYSSPFRRTLQTAHLGIPELECNYAGRSWWKRVGHWLRREFMLSECAQAPPVFTTDLLRERIANYTCDARSTVSQLAPQFPGVSFSEVPEEDLPFLAAKEHGPKEHSLMRARAARAVEWVMARPDGKLVALVAHGHFLLALTGLFQPTQRRVSEAAAPVNAAAAALRFANAERRALHICQCENGVQAGCDPACERATGLA